MKSIIEAQRIYIKIYFFKYSQKFNVFGIFSESSHFSNIFIIKIF